MIYNNMNSLNLVLGLYDNPEKQTQKDYCVDLISNNIAIFGSAMSGKTTLLKTLLLRLHQTARITEMEEIYILDFSNNLEEYKNLPYVVAYFDAFQEENVRRIFKTVEERYSANVRALPGKAFSQYEPGTMPAKDEPKHITFIIDGLNAFMAEDRYSAYHELLLKLARDGLSKGVSVIFTANDTSGGINRLLSSFSRVIAFDVPKDQYSELFGKRVEKPIVLEGRGMANIGADVYEFQAYYPFNRDDSAQNDKTAVDEIYRHLIACGCNQECDQYAYNEEILTCCIAKKMKSFSYDLFKTDWEKYLGVKWEDYRNSPDCGPSEFVAGLDYYSFSPVKIDLLKTRSIAIYGKKASGKTNLLSLILEAAKSIPDVRFVLWEDGRKGLSDPAKAAAVRNVLDSVREEQVKWIYERQEFEEYLREEGYYDLPESMGESYLIGDEDMGCDIWETEPESSEFPDAFQSPGIPQNFGKPKVPRFEKKNSPFTVFIIQSRLFYQQISGGPNKQLIPRLSPFIINEDPVNKKVFIFSDVQRITDGELNTYFNNCIDHAFLLNDILRFISDRGQKSVFGTFDPAELKESFGKCDLGDGFYLNLELDELQKLKFIKQL